MGQYISHKKFKIRKNAPPIVFNEEAAVKERESWEILSKVRELELKERAEKQAQRAIEKAKLLEAKRIEADVKSAKRKDFEKRLKEFKKLANDIFPWHSMKNAYSATKWRGIPLDPRAALAILWVYWSFGLNDIALKCANDDRDFLTKLPRPTHRRDVRAIIRMAILIGLHPRKDTIRSALKTRRLTVFVFERLYGTCNGRVWINADGEYWIKGVQ